MNSKYLVHQDCDVYFNYGVYTLEDFNFINLVIWFFESCFHKMYVYPSNYILGIYRTSFQKSSYENKTISASSQSSEISKCSYYESIFKAHNICVRDECFNDVDKRTKYDALNRVGLPSNLHKLKRQSKFLLFIITKNYLESSSFETDWNEAIELNRNVVIIFKKDEDFIKNIDSKRFDYHKTYCISDEFFQAMITYKCSNEMSLDEETFFAIFSSYYTKLKKVSS